MRKKQNKRLVAVAMVLLAIGFLFPLYWMVTMSFKTTTEITLNPFGLPAGWKLTNYVDAFAKMDFLPALKNSVLYAFGTCTMTVLFGAMAAYAICRMGWIHGERVRGFFMLVLGRAHV